MSTKLNKMVEARRAKTGETHQQALRHVREAERSAATAPSGESTIVMPRPNRLSPWVQDQDDFPYARNEAERRRRQVAAIMSSQQSGQPLPPLVPSHTFLSLSGGTAGAMEGTASLAVNLFGALGSGTVLDPLPPPRVELIGIAAIIRTWLAADPSMLHQLSAGQFQEFICDRLAAMGQEVKLVGGVYNKDGGIDIVFWPKAGNVIPILGAVQVKHHRDPSKKEGSGSVRDFKGAISGHEFGAAILATNTAFTLDAEWFARERPHLVRLRDFADMKGWIANDFSNREEWREMPESIELCPGVVVKIPRD